MTHAARAKGGGNAITVQGDRQGAQGRLAPNCASARFCKKMARIWARITDMRGLRRHRKARVPEGAAKPQVTYKPESRAPETSPRKPSTPAIRAQFHAPVLQNLAHPSFAARKERIPGSEGAPQKSRNLRRKQDSSGAGKRPRDEGPRKQGKHPGKGGPSRTKRRPRGRAPTPRAPQKRAPRSPEAPPSACLCEVAYFASWLVSTPSTSSPCSLTNWAAALRSSGVATTSSAKYSPAPLYGATSLWSQMSSS